MNRTNSLLSLQTAVTSTRHNNPLPLRRVQSAPTIIQTGERLNPAVNTYHHDDMFIGTDQQNLYVNIGSLVRHMDNIGIPNQNIQDILWSMNDSNPQILDEDLFNAHIEFRGFMGLLQASTFEVSISSINQLIRDSLNKDVLSFYKPSDTPPAA